jgi:hypothetical protein
MKTFKPESAEVPLLNRVLRTALTWGVPMLCLELVGIPRDDWGGILVLAVPGAIVGVVVYALFEHWLARRRRQTVIFSQKG